jgi:hypothetical protein
MEAALKTEVQRLIVELVSGDYAGICARHANGRVSEADMARVVREYGCTLMAVPEDGWALVDVYVSSRDPDHATVDVPLWTMEEGRSDLTLSLTARRAGDGFEVAMSDLYVP